MRGLTQDQESQDTQVRYGAGHRCEGCVQKLGHSTDTGSDLGHLLRHTTDIHQVALGAFSHAKDIYQVALESWVTLLYEHLSKEHHRHEWVRLSISDRTLRTGSLRQLSLTKHTTVCTYIML